MSELQKRIILTPQQLDRLLGRDKELISLFDRERRAALDNAVRDASTHGPSHAYAQYNIAQQRFLDKSARDRTEPLELVLSAPPPPQPPPPPIVPQASTASREQAPEQVQTSPTPRKRKKGTRKQKIARRLVENIEAELSRAEDLSPLMTRKGRVKTKKPAPKRWLMY